MLNYNIVMKLFIVFCFCIINGVNDNYRNNSSNHENTIIHNSDIDNISYESSSDNSHSTQVAKISTINRKICFSNLTSQETLMLALLKKSMKENFEIRAVYIFKEFLIDCDIKFEEKRKYFEEELNIPLEKININLPKDSKLND